MYRKSNDRVLLTALVVSLAAALPASSFAFGGNFKGKTKVGGSKSGDSKSGPAKWGGGKTSGGFKGGGHKAPANPFAWVGGGHGKGGPDGGHGKGGSHGKDGDGKDGYGKSKGGSSGKKCILFGIICWGGDSSGGGKDPKPSPQQNPEPDAQVNAAEAAAEAADPVNGLDGSANPEDDRIAVTPPETLPGDDRVPVGETEEEDEEIEADPVPMQASVLNSGALLSNYGAMGAPSIGRGREVRGVSSSVDAQLASAKLGASALDKKWGLVDVSAKGLEGANREVSGKILGADGAGVRIAQIRAELDRNDPNRADIISTAGQRYLQGAQSFHSLGDYESALRQAEAAIRADGKSSLGYLAKAKALIGLGRYKEAEQFAQFARDHARTRNTKSEAASVMAMALQKQGRLKDALASAEAATRLATGDRFLTGALATKAFVCEQSGDRECLLEALKRASEIDKAYERHYMLARQGKRVFDPNVTDADALMNALGELPEDGEGGPSRSKWWFLLPGLLILAGFASTVRAYRAIPPSVEKMREGLSRAAAAAVPPSEAEAMLDGKYELTKVVGRGGFGQVWEAVDHSLGRTVAIKKMAVGEIADSTKGRAEFLEEARTLAALNHPNIVEIFAVLDRPEGLYLVFEMLDGKTVQQILAEQHRLPLANAKRILLAAAAGLEEAHARGVVHRDLKPANLMLTTQGFVKVMDFGIARRQGAVLAHPAAPAPLAESGVPTIRTRTLAGTPGYMAPEAKEGTVSARSDVYALGACLHELLFGRLPETGGGGELILEDAPPELAGLLRDSLAPDPGARLSSARLFAERLAAVPENVETV